MHWLECTLSDVLVCNCHMWRWCASSGCHIHTKNTCSNCCSFFGVGCGVCSTGHIGCWSRSSIGWRRCGRWSVDLSSVACPATSSLTASATLSTTTSVCSVWCWLINVWWNRRVLQVEEVICFSVVVLARAATLAGSQVGHQPYWLLVSFLHRVVALWPLERSFVLHTAVYCSALV